MEISFEYKLKTKKMPSNEDIFYVQDDVQGRTNVAGAGDER